MSLNSKKIRVYLRPKRLTYSFLVHKKVLNWAPYAQNRKKERGFFMSTVTAETGDIDYAALYQQEMEHLDTITDSSSAWEYCMTVVLQTVMASIEQNIHDLGGIEEDLTDGLNYFNDIERIVNLGANVDPNDPSAVAAYAGTPGTDGQPPTDTNSVAYAQWEAQQMTALLNQDASVLGQSTVDSITTQLTVLFPPGESPTQIATDWSTAWDVSSASSVDPNDSANDGVSQAQDNTDAMDPISDAMTNISNSLSSMQSSVNSQAQYLESEDSEMGSLINTLYTNWSQEMQTSTNNMASASS